MAEQQEEINVTTGPAQQKAQRINVITNSSNGTLKGNPPPMFNGDGDTTQKFVTAFNVWRVINHTNNTMKKPFSRVVTMLSYMDGKKVSTWKEEQLLKPQEEMDNGALETDEALWDNFIENFKLANWHSPTKTGKLKPTKSYANSNKEKAFMSSLLTSNTFANKAGVPLDNKGTIETLKHTITKELTRAVIHSPDHDPTTNIPWGFKQWKKQARKSYYKWKAASEYNQ